MKLKLLSLAFIATNVQATTSGNDDNQSDSPVVNIGIQNNVPYILHLKMFGCVDLVFHHKVAPITVSILIRKLSTNMVNQKTINLAMFLRHLLAMKKLCRVSFNVQQN